MGRDNLEFMNIAVIGNTRLTYNLLYLLEKIRRPQFVFGLPDNLLAQKANAIQLDEFCFAKGILLDKSNDMVRLEQLCKKHHIQTILDFGDSRILPQTITANYQVIGNHGAVLPFVKGGASLVWGRLIDYGKGQQGREWGISLFELIEKIDAGDILATAIFRYDPQLSMQDFVRLADDLTIKTFERMINEGYERQKNQAWQVRVAKKTDSFAAVKILETALAVKMRIYMPSRLPDESRLREWPVAFQDAFKRAHDVPYPRWFR